MRKSLEPEATGDTVPTDEAAILDQIEKLSENILHLQSCAIKKFDDFRQKMDGIILRVLFFLK